MLLIFWAKRCFSDLTQSCLQLKDHWWCWAHLSRILHLNPQQQCLRICKHMTTCLLKVTGLYGYLWHASAGTYQMITWETSTNYQMSFGSPSRSSRSEAMPASTTSPGQMEWTVTGFLRQLVMFMFGAKCKKTTYKALQQQEQQPRQPTRTKKKTRHSHSLTTIKSINRSTGHQAPYQRHLAKTVTKQFPLFLLLHGLV